VVVSGSWSETLLSDLMAGDVSTMLVEIARNGGARAITWQTFDPVINVTFKDGREITDETKLARVGDEGKVEVALVLSASMDLAYPIDQRTNDRRYILSRCRNRGIHRHEASPQRSERPGRC
jgi:hypothetical protein